MRKAQLLSLPHVHVTSFLRSCSCPARKGRAPVEDIAIGIDDNVAVAWTARRADSTVEDIDTAARSYLYTVALARQKVAHLASKTCKGTLFLHSSSGNSIQLISRCMELLRQITILLECRFKLWPRLRPAVPQTLLASSAPPFCQ